MWNTPQSASEDKLELKGTRGIRLIYLLTNGADTRKYFRIISNLLGGHRKLLLQYTEHHPLTYMRKISTGQSAYDNIDSFMNFAIDMHTLAKKKYILLLVV